MNLTPAQKTIANDLHRFRVLNCGRRFGKTVLAVEEMVGVALAKKDRRVAYFAPTRDDAWEITWGMLINKCESIITYKNESKMQIRIMTQDGGESTIALYGWESVQERGKGRGLANDFIVCDEVSSYRNFWLGWNEVLSPTLIDRKGSAMFISTPKGFNHFYDLYNMEAKDPDYKSFHFTSYDNVHIPVEEIEREKLSKPENTFAQEYMADFRKMEGLVYKEFDRSVHVYDDLTPRTRSIGHTYCGIDFGFQNPTAILKLERDTDNHYWLSYEWVHRGKFMPEIIEQAHAIKADSYYPDHAERDKIEELKRAGINVHDVSKEVVAGLDSVRSLFVQNRLHIHQNCINTIAELETYRYKESRPDANEPEEPVKDNDHCMDALRYVIHMVEHNIPEAEEQLLGVY